MNTDATAQSAAGALPEAVAPPACENCGSALQGHYCHVCGQRAHNPLRDFAHAVEEVFESLWHLDGRIFRTVRELFIPGRVATRYLAGHRVRYIAPLRLFVILSLVTFFVGKLSISLDPQTPPTDSGKPASSGVMIQGERDVATGQFAEAKTAAEVVALHARAVANIEQARKDEVGSWIMSVIDETTAAQFRIAAIDRLRELKATPEQIRAVETAHAAVMASKDAQAKDGKASSAQRILAQDGWFNRWMAKKIRRMESNVKLVQEDPDTVFKQFLGAIPGALFVLVPVFALLLRIAYLGSGRGYLEHLVVALYSHAFLLSALLIMFSVAGLQRAFGDPPWFEFAGGAIDAALTLWVPVYLLLMQRRVYAQSWLWTIAKYLALGSLYCFMVIMALLYAALAGFAS